MLRGCNNMGTMRLIYIRNDNYRPTKLKEFVKSGEVDVPRTIPPLYSVVLKVSYICRVYLDKEFANQCSIQDSQLYGYLLNGGRNPTRSADQQGYSLSSSSVIATDYGEYLRALQLW